MKFNIDLGFTGNICSESNSIFDDLVIKIDELFRSDGVPGFVNLLVDLFDQNVCGEVLGPWTEGHLAYLKKSCCKSPYFERVKKEKKTVLCRLGSVRFYWSRVRCKHCGDSFVPLRAKFGFKQHQNHSLEFEKTICETIADQSYRRNGKQFSLIGGIRVSHSKIYRIVMNSKCDKIDPNVRSKDLKYLIADGTGFPEFKPQKPSFKESTSAKETEVEADIDLNIILNDLKKAQKAAPNILNSEPESDLKKSEVKIVIGINGAGDIIPVGVWAKTGWASISKQIMRANNHPRIKPKPIADLLICDGEESLIRYMSKLTVSVQRCLWHMPHELTHIMRYKENVSKEKAFEMAGKLHDIEFMDAPTDKSDESAIKLQVRIFEAEKSIGDLIVELRDLGYFAAANYVENAKKHLFSYLKYWLRTGVLPPRVTSRVERMMREIGRRIKKIGFNWKAKGVAKITRIVLKLIATNNEWQNYWDGVIKRSAGTCLTFTGAYIRTL